MEVKFWFDFLLEKGPIDISQTHKTGARPRLSTQIEVQSEGAKDSAVELRADGTRHLGAAMDRRSSKSCKNCSQTTHAVFSLSLPHCFNSAPKSDFDPIELETSVK